MIRGMLKKDIALHWDELASLLEKPLQKTGVERMYSVDDVLWRCVENDWQCWVAQTDKIDAAFVTYITPYPSGLRTLTVYLAGGLKMDEWLETVWEVFKEFAKENGADEIVVPGREGWPRVLRKFEPNRFDAYNAYTVRI